MASPTVAVAVSNNPTDAGQHLLYFLTPNRQLALEHRSTDKPSGYEHYVNRGVSQGVIVKGTSIAAVTNKGLINVYGITCPKENHFVSRLSPIFNPLSKELDAVTTEGALAATTNSDGTDYVYFLQSTGGDTAKLVEAELGEGESSIETFSDPVPLRDSKLAAVYNPATGERFAFYQVFNPKKKSLFWTNSKNQDDTAIDGTVGVKYASPLAVTSTTTTDANGNTRFAIFLYYVDGVNKLQRAVGTVSDTKSTIEWSTPKAPANAPYLDDSTLLSATTDGSKIFVYHIPQSNKSDKPFVPYIDKITSEMFK